MARSRWKFFFYENNLWKFFFKKTYGNQKIEFSKKIYKKYSNIPHFLVNKDVNIHQGNSFLKKKINKWMIGHKFGKFIFTRKPFFFPIKKNKNNKIRR